ncbi:MAG: molybdopterin-guanine dinucleotide biosynthesis protein B [Pseudomonadota bacterium]
MRVIGIVGRKHVGKTTLVERLVAEIAGRGLSVSTVKHTHHAIDLEHPGTDTDRHRAAGAAEVMLASASRWALMREHRGAGEPALADLVGRLAPVDLVIVEGFSRSAHPKLEVVRLAQSRDLIAPGDPTVRALAASPFPLPEELASGRPALALDDIAGLADLALAEARALA